MTQSKSQIQLLSRSPQETQVFAASIAKILKGGEVITLEGELGAGKTVFVRGLAEGLSLPVQSVSSPTFVICQEYEQDDSNALSMIHIDAYRLSGPDELETIGWSEILRNQTSVVAIEWPSRIAKALPPNRIDVRLEHIDSHTRSITIAAPAAVLKQIETTMQSREKTNQPKFKCRTCGRAVAEDAASFPFCSERCRMSDLGRWFTEGYRVSRPMQADDDLED